MVAKNSERKRYLVTGGAGFIGSNLTERLASEGREVIVVDNLSTGSLKNLKAVEKKIKFIKSPVAKALKNKNIRKLDGIYHCGIPSSTLLYRGNPYFVGEAINEFIDMLELAKRENCKLVYASSSSVYNGNPTPFKEDMPVLVKDLYTEARYAMERLSHLYYDWYKVKSIGIRFFSVYGPHEEAKKNFANLVTRFLWAAKKNKKAIVYGDGNQTRDFTYVKDIIEGCVLAMNSKKVEHDIFNIGAGCQFTINEMLKILGKNLNKKIEIKHVPNPLRGYVYKTWADTSKAEKALGFKPQYPFEKGLKEIIEYYK
ncbi:NAD-dependent epimerase/dehydratase family protein [Patescibacteria group bacterium]|nr:NAD-dependent epimerase/dehydratase family protein [Patescibacteria group bacterium]MBU3999799.1 NAD-dependent epimerase/dehydratase family protein [Patescibacteria group bacterium]MBU4056290.1 NAD-dependent epimerase/dehydratase family protein [Patescibacteria group bacterium]MBU4368746.1 NAD-dependent epimerase/dehydratase family protein [Patescibacteria group bacterium]